MNVWPAIRIYIDINMVTLVAVCSRSALVQHCAYLSRGGLIHREGKKMNTVECIYASDLLPNICNMCFCVLFFRAHNAIDDIIRNVILISRLPGLLYSPNRKDHFISFFSFAWNLNGKISAARSELVIFLFWSGEWMRFFMFSREYYTQGKHVAAISNLCIALVWAHAIETAAADAFVVRYWMYSQKCFCLHLNSAQCAYFKNINSIYLSCICVWDLRTLHPVGWNTEINKMETHRM